MDEKKDMPSMEKSDEVYGGSDEMDVEPAKTGVLSRDLQGRHMQMIAIGGSIGAGLFVGSGPGFVHGGPGAVLIGFMITGVMLLCTVQALGELAVLYPVNGAFYQYMCRFIDPSWGFAIGWDYAISWLTVLPFELITASLTISYWNDTINPGVWITVFLAALVAIQVFGVRGYGEVEFVLGVIKVTAIIGFIILAIIIDTGGVPTDDRGYLGARYWHHPGAFHDGFRGFCSVFVNAAFAFAGTELVGLAAAEAADPRKSLPKASKQVFWRIAGFYILALFMVGLVVPSDSDRLLGASSDNTAASPFVLAISLANIKGLPSVMNAVITISVISVANSCTFGSTRTMQAMAADGMAPKFLAYVDNKGRPIWCIVVQLLFGCLAFIQEAPVGTTVFSWLLALSGLSYFFVWGSICLAHIRFRRAWKLQGHTLDELPFKAGFGVVGSWIGLIIAWLAVIASFYTAIWPPGASPDAQYFFQQYMAVPIIIFLYFIWKCVTRFRGGLFVRIEDMDLKTGMRDLDLDSADEVIEKKSLGKRIADMIF